MKLNKETISEIIKENDKFISAYSDPESYFIYGSQVHFDSDYDEKTIEFYYDKLKYVVHNSDLLIKAAFREEFYDFYGVDKTTVSSPEQMCSELVVESFSMDVDDMTVGAYLSNEHFMPGHFIEVHWDNEWKISYLWID